MPTALSPFDPYAEWLGIAPEERPIDNYRLLGLSRFETDASRIASAADERMGQIRKFQTGPRGRYTQKLLNELAAAKGCLLSPERKAAYDQALHQQLVAAGPRIDFYGSLGHAVPPPPPPGQPSVWIETEIAEFEEPAESVPWWHRAVLSATAAVLVLCGVVAWGIATGQFKKDARRTSSSSSSSELPEDESTEEASEELDAREPTVARHRKPLVLKQEGTGEVNFSAATATTSGGIELRTSTSGDRLINWTNPDASAEWPFHLVVPGSFRLEINYAVASGAGGAELEAAIGNQTRRCQLRSSGGLDRFISDTFEIPVPAAGEHKLLLRPATRPAGDWLAIQSVRLIPEAPIARPLTVEP